jgi:hypothetical protein
VVSLTLDLEQASKDIGISQHKYLWDWLADHVAPGDVLLLEKFEFQKDKQDRDNLNYDAGEYVGVIRIWCDLNHVLCIMVSPSQKGKGENHFWNDDKLKRVELWKGRSRHERDAIRHLLNYLVFTLHDGSWLAKLKK